ncbi:hypothetical protein D3C87_299120 [compost metagenome]
MSTPFIYSIVQITGILFLISGMVIRYFINRRRFNRRNQYGTQGFNSYEHRTLTNIGEGFGKMGAYILILIGLFLILLVWVNRKMDRNANKKKQEISTPIKRR